MCLGIEQRFCVCVCECVCWMGGEGVVCMYVSMSLYVLLCVDVGRQTTLAQNWTAASTVSEDA